MLSYISPTFVTGRHTHDTCERVVQQATKSDRFVTRQGCQIVRQGDVAISAALNDRHPAGRMLSAQRSESFGICSSTWPARWDCLLDHPLLWSTFSNRRQPTAPQQWPHSPNDGRSSRRDCSRRGAAGPPEPRDRTLEPRSCSRTLHAYHRGHHVPRKRAYPRNTAALQTTPAWCSPTAQRAFQRHLRKLGFSAAGRALRVLCRSEAAAQDRAGPRGGASLPRADWRGGYPRCAPI
jgi:hypothetical protein